MGQRGSLAAAQILEAEDRRSHLPKSEDDLRSISLRLKVAEDELTSVTVTVFRLECSVTVTTILRICMWLERLRNERLLQH